MYLIKLEEEKEERKFIILGGMVSGSLERNLDNVFGDGYDADRE